METYYYSFFFSEAPKERKFIMDIPGNSPLTAITNLLTIAPDRALADISVIVKQTGKTGTISTK